MRKYLLAAMLVTTPLTANAVPICDPSSMKIEHTLRSPDTTSFSTERVGEAAYTPIMYYWIFKYGSDKIVQASRYVVDCVTMSVTRVSHANVPISTHNGVTLQANICNAEVVVTESPKNFDPTTYNLPAFVAGAHHCAINDWRP